jgi:hypothetical protein
LGDDGWLLWGNVFDAADPPNLLWNYGGPWPAPNHGGAISAVVAGEGDPSQGEQQLSVFNNYGDGAHGACGPGGTSSPTCLFIEINVFQEQVIGAADVGTTWLFEFDAKRGNIEGATTALGFIKTIHPTEYWLSSFIPIDMTGVPTTWDSYVASIYIHPGLEGHILQFGFLNKATDYEGSGIFYDNVGFDLAPLSVSLDIKPGGDPNSINPYSRGVVPVAILGSATFDVTDVDVTTLSFGPGAASPAHNLTDSFTYNDHLRDVNFDGYLDLVSHYRTRDTGIACGDDSATLTGETLGGQAIEGSDSIQTVGCRVSTRPVWMSDQQDRAHTPRRSGPVNIEGN